MIEIPGRFAARIRRKTEHEIHFGITGEEFRRWHVDSMVAVSIAFFVLAAGAALQAIIPPPDHLPQALIPDGEYFARHRYLVGDGTLAEVEEIARQLLPYGFQGPKMRVAYVELADGNVIDGGMRLLRAFQPRTANQQKNA